MGQRTEDVWDGEPEGVYVPTAAKATMVCTSANAEIFIAGARYDKVLDAFSVRTNELDEVQYQQLVYFYYHMAQYACFFLTYLLAQDDRP